MARTLPRSLLDEDLKSDAERKVFEALRDQLCYEWSVFHSASVIYRDHAEGARDDEGDFVLCHPERGTVCLEVTGGGIECRHGTFYRLPAGGPRERMPDPFGRSLDHRYALEGKIAEVEGWKDRRLFLVHAWPSPGLVVAGQRGLQPASGSRRSGYDGSLACLGVERFWRHVEPVRP